MSRKIFSFLVSALLLVQFSNAAPVPRQEIGDYVFVQSANFMKNLLMEGIPVLENVKEKAAKYEPKSAVLNDYLEKFDQAENRIKELNEAKLSPRAALNIFQYSGSFFQLLQRYEREGFPTELTLNKNGKIEYTAYYEKSFQEFSGELIEYLDRYIAGLSSEEKFNEAKLIQWFDDFKDVNKRSLTDLAALLGLFDFEDLEKYL